MGRLVSLTTMNKEHFHVAITDKHGNGATVPDDTGHTHRVIAWKSQLGGTVPHTHETARNSIIDCTDTRL